MSNVPFAGEFVSQGVGMTIPGYAMSVTTPGRAPVGSGRLRPPGVSFGPETKFAPTFNVGRDGLPKGKKNNVELQSNTFIVNTFPVKIGAERNELQIIEGMLLFLLTHTTTLKIDGLHVTMHTPLSLGQLNMYLDRAWDKFQSNIGMHDQDALRVQYLMKRVSEDTFNHYVACISPGTSTPIHTAFFDVSQHGEVIELYNLCKKNDTYMLCMCPQAIIHFARFVGVVLNVGRDTTFDSHVGATNNSIILPFGVIETGVAEVHDIFTPTVEMQVGAKLWIHYRRRRTGAGFVAVPVCAKMKQHLNMFACYRDGTGVACSGIAEEIGTVLHNKDRDDYETTMRRASGVDRSADLEQIKRAVANTGKITLDLQHLR